MMSVRSAAVAAGLAAAVALATAPPVRALADARCDAGTFCAWAGTAYTGRVARFDLESAAPNQCVPLPDKLVAKSLANLMTRDVSVYQGAACSTEMEFTTYPKGGTFVPNAPFVVRAIQVWE
jgi:hypothetical protein